MLLEPEIHWNTGNAGRSCLAAGAQLHLIEPLGFSLDENQVRRAGLDYWPRVKPRVWPDWASFQAQLPKLGQAFFVSLNVSTCVGIALYEVLRQRGLNKNRDREP